MQSYAQKQSVVLQMLTQQQTSCSQMPSSTPQMQYYIPQQRISNHQNHQQSQGLWSGQQTSFQPQTPQAWSTDFQNPTPFTNSPATRSTLPNGQLPAAQHGTLTYTYHPQDLNGNTVPQQDCNMPQVTGNSFVSYFPSPYSITSSATEENNLTHQTVLHQTVLPQSLNGHQNRIQTANQTPQEIPRAQMGEGRTNGGLYRIANQFPAKNQCLATPNYTYPSCPSRPSGNATQVQHLSQIENKSPYYVKFAIGGNNHTAAPPPYTSQHSAIQTPSNQAMNQIISLRLHQNRVQHQQSNTTPVSGHQSKTSHLAVPATQRNTLPQGVQLNKGNTALPVSSQATVSSSTPTNSPYFSDVFTKMDNPQVLPQSHYPTLKSRSASQGQTLRPNTAKPSSTQTLVSGLYSMVSAKSRETRSSENHLKSDVRSFEGFWKDSNCKTTPLRNNGLGQAEHAKNVTKPQELFTPLQKVVLQSHKAVAVVPPISQQVPSPDKHIESIPFKDDAVWGAKDVESNAPCLDKEAGDEIQPYTEPVDESTADCSLPDTQNISVTQTDISSQGSLCSTASASKSPEDHRGVTADKLNGDVFHLSEVQVRTFTLNTVRSMLSHLESTQKSQKNPVENLEECLLHLYWGGNEINVLKKAKTYMEEYINRISTESIKETETAVFQHLQQKDLMRLADGYHILNDETIPPADEFRSSWLNLDGQPADIANVLAEPVKDFNLPSYGLQGGFYNQNLYSEPGPSTNMIPTTSDGQNDQMNNEDITDVTVCTSKFTDQVSNMHETSKKQGDASLEDDRVQNTSLEQSVESNEIADALTESRCEAECTDAGEEIISSSEMVEKEDLPIYLNSSNDSKIFPQLLLASDADDNSIKGREVKKAPPHLCQDEIPEVSATPENHADASCRPVHRIKFTCPHVTENDLDGEPFCSRCWEETPLLDLDLEESSPEPRTPQVDSFEGIVSEPIEICMSLDDELLLEAPSDVQNVETPVIPEQPKTQTDEVSLPCNKLKLTETAEDAFFTTDIVAVKTSSPKPRPNGQNCQGEPTESGEGRKSSIKVKTQTSSPSPLPDKQDPNGNEWSSSNSSSPPTSLDASVPTQSSMFDTTPDKQTCGPQFSQVVRSANESNMTKSSGGKISPPKYPRKILKVTKTISIPTIDDLFAPDIIVKKHTSPKSQPNDLSVPKDGPGCKGKRGERGGAKSPITLNKQHIGQTEVDTPHKQTPAKSPAPHGTPRENTSANRDKNEANKLTKKLALYGLQSGNRNTTRQHHQCLNKAKLSTAPAYITLSNSPENAKNYTDTPSAKQKVYNRWSSTFFSDTNKKQKRPQKSEKVELKSRIQVLKRDLVEKQFMDMLVDFDVGPKAKKIKLNHDIFNELF